MATAKLSGVVRRFAPPAPDTPDAELLRRFAQTRDEDAFGELVARYGPLVFAVCKRVTGSHHLSEDAFQAVFVVLAAKAGSVRAGALPAFLHAVAARTALRARTVSDRRRRRETPVAELPDAAESEAESAADADLAAVVDAEIARLPEALRVAVVLCELDGLSRKDAAARLGVPEGTVSSRLAAARKVLAGRLRGRGFVRGAGGVSALLGARASAGVPAGLTARAVAGALSPALRPAAVQSLSTGVLHAMLAHKLKLVVPLAVLVLGALAYAALAGPPEPPAAPALVRAEPPEPKAAAKPLAKGPNKLLYWNTGKLVLADPDGKNPKELALKGNDFHAAARLSPDGKRIAFLLPSKLTTDDPNLTTDDARAKVQRAYLKLHVRGLDEDGEGTDLGVQCEMFAWSPDGTEIGCTSVADKRGQQPEMTSFVVTVKTKEKTALKLPAGHVVTDWAPDGRLVTSSVAGTEWANIKARLHLMNRDGTEHKALAPDTNAMIGRISPDGKRVLCVLVTLPEEDAAEKKARQEAGRRGPEPTRELAVLDVATGKFAKVQEVPLNAELQEGYCWSPDGKRIAYTWREKHAGKPEDAINKETESHLIVCDADGKNAKTIASHTGKGQWHVTLSGVDWR